MIGIDFIRSKEDQIHRLCQKYRVKSFYVFGSFLEFPYNEDSDLTFIAEHYPIDDPLERGENHWNFIMGLEDLFGRLVHVYNESSVTNPYLKQIMNDTKQLIYSETSYNKEAERVVKNIEID